MSKIGMKSLSLILSVVCLITFLNFSSAVTITNTPSGDITIPGHTAYINSTIDSDNPLDTVSVNLSGTITNIKDPSLILCYNFDNQSSLGENDTYVVDWCGGNNGTVIGGSNVSMTPNGKYNGAVNFSGNVNYINIPNTVNGVNSTHDFTISLWFYTLNSSGASTQVLYTSAPSATDKFLIAIFNGKIGITFVNSSGNTRGVKGSDNIIANNHWYNLIYKFNGASGSASLWLNGVSQSNSTNFPTTASNTGVAIGRRLDNTRFMNGDIDEVKIWNRMLTNDEITSAYQSSLNKFNSTRYILFNNQTGINGLSSVYQISFNDSLNNNVQSINQLILRNQNILLSTNNLWNINLNFYGVNTYDSFITRSNRTWLENLLSQSKMVYHRIEFDFPTIYNANNISFGFVSNDYNNNFTDLGRLANLNGYKLLITLNGIPDGLANTTSGCNPNGVYGKFHCSPNNYTTYARMAVDAVDRMTNNGLYNDSIEIEIMNEPEGGTYGLWDNVTTNDDISKAYEYIKMYNYSYNAIKLKYPTIKIGGPATSTADTSNMINTFMSNASSNGYGIDFITYHRYTDYPYTSIPNDLNTFTTKCSTYSISCARIIISEWNVINTTMKNTSSLSNEYGKQTSLTYLYLLNNNPQNVSSMFFTFTQYGKYNSSYSGYPNLWSMVSRPIDDNAIYPPYSVTANFTRYAPPGFSVYNSTNDYPDGILQVYTKSGNTHNLIITNVEDDLQNISISGLSANELLIDTNTGTLYQANSSGILNYGVLGNYSVTPLTNPTLTLIEGTGLVKSNYLNETLFIGNESWISLDQITDTNRIIHIASNLTSGVTAGLQINNVDCSKLNSISYTPNGSSKIGLSYSCNQSSGIVTIASIIINPSIESNILEMDIQSPIVGNACNNFNEGFGEFGSMLAVIGLAVALVIAISLLYASGKIDATFIAPAIIILVIVTISIILGINLLQELCELS